MWRCFYSCAFFIFMMDVLREIFRRVYFRRKENVSRHPSHERRQMMERGLLSTAPLLGNQNWTSLKFLQTLQSSEKKATVSFGSGATFSNLPRVRETRERSSRVTQGGGGRAGLLFHPFPCQSLEKCLSCPHASPLPSPLRCAGPPPLQNCSQRNNDLIENTCLYTFTASKKRMTLKTDNQG